MFENGSSGYPTISDTNRPVQLQKMARSYSSIRKWEDLYHMSSEDFQPGPTQSDLYSLGKMLEA